MNLYQLLKSKNTSISVIGLGYVGLPIAIAFAESSIKVIGYDISKKRLDELSDHFDNTGEISKKRLKDVSVLYTSDPNHLKEALFHIITVPTPINQDKTPNLNPVIEATEILGRNLSKGSIVVYESTVYPGVTEDVCIPLLEKLSGLKAGQDFKVGYSPERINPGDTKHTVRNIKKIVSGMDKESLDIIASVYEIIVEVGVHKSSSIKVAEAAKVVENSQRDINIAFMNELAMVFDLMDIDTNEVIEAMNTKWNALGFTPGLVGGHCIGVDPYYFLYEAERLGYHSQIITSGRKINNGMVRFVTDAIIRQMILANHIIKESKIAILGVTFKENCPDVRNSKVFEIIQELKKIGVHPMVSDPIADPIEVNNLEDIQLININEIKELDVLVIAVSHKEYLDLDLKDIEMMFDQKQKSPIIIDIKNTLSKNISTKFDFYWSL